MYTQHKYSSTKLYWICNLYLRVSIDLIARDHQCESECTTETNVYSPVAFTLLCKKGTTQFKVQVWKTWPLIRHFFMPTKQLANQLVYSSKLYFIQQIGRKKKLFYMNLSPMNLAVHLSGSKLLCKFLLHLKCIHKNDGVDMLYQKINNSYQIISVFRTRWLFWISFNTHVFLQDINIGNWWQFGSANVWNGLCIAFMIILYSQIKSNTILCGWYIDKAEIICKWFIMKIWLECVLMDWISNLELLMHLNLFQNGVVKIISDMKFIIK